MAPLATETALEKVCPVVLSERDGAVHILTFHHPLAGFQLVKGTIEPGESPAIAANRELLEESGLVALGPPTHLFSATDLPHPSCWHFYLCNVAPELPDTWDHDTDDDGGHTFHFFWHRLDAPASEDWHSLFAVVLAQIARHLERAAR